jgi:anti-anti-sigma factor
MYWAILGQGIKERAAELGARLSVATYTLGDNHEAAEALLRHQRLDVLIATTSPDDDDMVPRANTAGVPVIRVGGASSQVACDIQCEERAVAELIAEQMLQKINYRGEIIEICGWDAVFERAEGFHTAIEWHPSVQITGTYNAHWSGDEARAHMRAALATHPQVRGVFCHNDDLALGALAAIDEAGRSDSIVVTGFDGVPDGLLAVRSGRLAATAYRSQRIVGHRAVEIALELAQGRPVPRQVRTEALLVTAENAADAMLDTVALIPKLLADLVEGSTAQQQLQEEVIATQQSIIQELSTPIIPITDNMLIVPLIGAIDAPRAQRITETLLEAIALHQSEIVLLDITGVGVIDTQTAQSLMRAAQAAQLLGTQLFLVGISSEVAQTMVHLGIDLSRVRTFGSLRAGFAAAMGQ